MTSLIFPNVTRSVALNGMINLDQLLALARLLLGLTTKGPFPGMRTTRRFNKPFAATVILVLEIALVTIQMDRR